MSQELHGSNQAGLSMEYGNSIAIFPTSSYKVKDEQNLEYVDFLSARKTINPNDSSISSDNLNFWGNVDISHENQMKAQFLRKSLAVLIKRHPEIKGSLKGKGLSQGIACGVEGLASKICEVAKENGLLVGNTGKHKEVITIMPPDTINIYGLEKGLEILNNSINSPKVQLMIRQYNSAKMENLAAF